MLETIKHSASLFSSCINRSTTQRFTGVQFTNRRRDDCTNYVHLIKKLAASERRQCARASLQIQKKRDTDRRVDRTTSFQYSPRMGCLIERGAVNFPYAVCERCRVTALSAGKTRINKDVQDSCSLLYAGTPINDIYVFKLF